MEGYPSAYDEMMILMLILRQKRREITKVIGNERKRMENQTTYSTSEKIRRKFPENYKQSAYMHAESVILSS